MIATGLCHAVNAQPFMVRKPDAPEVWEQTAATELESYMKKVALSGSVSVEGLDSVVFHVGNTGLAKSKGLGSDSFADEEWCVRSFGRDVVLNGGGTRGALYAVYHFLEDDCGVRWWMDGDEDVPAPSALEFTKLDRRGRPLLQVRDIYRDSPADFRTAVRNRLNGNGKVDIPLAWGGGVVYGLPHHCHVWDRYLPFEKYGKSHPEWYSLVGEKRVGGQHAGQLCLSNSEVLDMIEKGVRKSIEEDVKTARRRGTAMPRIYDVSMNDNFHFCECANCRAEVERVGHSGQQIRFSNEIARRIGKDHPELRFQMLAYHYSEPVPKTDICADDNVIVRFCNTRQNMAAGIREKDNVFMHDQVKAWSRHAKNLLIWDYAITYREPTRGFPFASEFYIADKVRFYAENGVTGLFFEHEEPWQSDMFELKFWLECKTFENPMSDGDVLIADFMRRYYGPAGAKILEARRILDRARREKKAFLTWFPSFSEFNFVSNEDIAAMERLYDEAKALVAGDAKRERRVDKARASVRRLHDYRAKYGAKHAPETGVSDRPFFDFPVDDQKLYAFHDRSHKLIDMVVDPDVGDRLAGGGKVVRIKADSDGYGMPFAMGVYDFVNKKVEARKRWEKPIGPGYNWYDLGEVALPETFFVYFTRQWTVDLPVGMEGLNGGCFRIKALVKFTGPRFFPDSKDPNEIRIARTIFADADTGTITGSKSVN